MASEPTPQQLITQSAQATADAIASALTARTASISLPIYDWDSKAAYHSFSIFWHTLENWLLLNCIPLDSKDHLRYVFAAWEPNPWRCMHNECLPAAKRNRKQPRQKLLPSLTKSNREWHTTSTPMCALENSKILWPGLERTPKISLHASRHWRTSARWSVMSIESMNCITVSSVHTAMRESSLGNLWKSHSRHPPVSWLTSWWTILPFSIPRNKSPTAPNLWMQSARTSGKWPTPATIAMVTHHLHPPRTAPTPHDSTQLAEQTALHVIPIALYATRWDTGDQNAMVASHSNQGMHLHLGHSRGSPDAHLRTTITTMGQDNKTDAIDVSKDHSPQDEIALLYIQPHLTVRNTHPKEIMVRDVCAPQCNEAYTTI